MGLFNRILFPVDMSEVCKKNGTQQQGNIRSFIWKHCRICYQPLSYSGADYQSWDAGQYGKLLLRINAFFLSWLLFRSKSSDLKGALTVAGHGRLEQPDVVIKMDHAKIRLDC